MHAPDTVDPENANFRGKIDRFCLPREGRLGLVCPIRIPEVESKALVGVGPGERRLRWLHWQRQ